MLAFFGWYTITEHRRRLLLAVGLVFLLGILIECTLIRPTYGNEMYSLILTFIENGLYNLDFFFNQLLRLEWIWLRLFH